MMSKEEFFTMDEASTCIAIPCYGGHVPIETALALAQVSAEYVRMGVTVEYISERENALIVGARNKLLTRFLTETDCNYLFWLDDDIIFARDDFIKVVALATEYDVVSGSYPARKEEPTFFIRSVTEGVPEFEPRMGLLKTKGTGLGFTCIKRKVIEEFVKTKDMYEDKEGMKVYNAFRTSVHDGRFWGEDILFFEDLYSMGYTNYVDISMNFKHVGRKDYDFKLLDYVEFTPNQGED